MNVVLSPYASEFETAQQAADYDRWFRAQIQASLDDTRPCIPHDLVMAEMDAIIAEAEKINTNITEVTNEISAGYFDEPPM